MQELKKELEKRKENLISLLKNKKDFLEIEKQHQIYGAIKELDHVIKLIEEQREAEYVARHEPMMQEEAITLTALTNEGNVTITATKVEEKKRGFRIPLKIRFGKNDA